MLFLRNFSFLSNVTKQNIKVTKCIPQLVRQLRNQPKKHSEYENNANDDEHLGQQEQSSGINKNVHNRITKSVSKLLKEELRLIETEHDTNVNASGTTTPPSNSNTAGSLFSDEHYLANDENSLEIEKAKKDYVPTFNLAAYVNKSTTLKQLLQLGVDLHSIERRKGLAKFVLGLDFEKDVQPYLYFLQDQGLSADTFGEFITKNPLFFKVDIDDLQTRVNYLESKKFTPEQRQRIFTRNPYWLMFSTRRIDRRLGHFQKEFQLSGDDIRFLASKQPRLITYSMDHIRKSTFCIREEMGFDKYEIKCLLLNKPRLWMMKSDDLIERFAYAHQTMKLSHDMLIQFPEVLTSREFRLRQRHGFLVTLGRAQYDPEKDLYISPRDLVSGNDFHFVRHVAKSDLETYELFLKTL